MDTRAAFSLLGISPGATPDAIRDAYRDLAKVWHPDRFAGDARLQAKASERMRELNEAYRIASALGGDMAPPWGQRHRGPARTTVAAGAAAPHRHDPRQGASARRPGLHRYRRSTRCGGRCSGLERAASRSSPSPPPRGSSRWGRGRAVAREARPRTAEAINYARLPESETGEATLVSRVRGTWVVTEHDGAAWLPAGTRLDVQRGTLSCAPSIACDASFYPVGASRLALRGATPEDAREIEVLLRVADGDAAAGASGRPADGEADPPGAAGARRRAWVRRRAVAPAISRARPRRRRPARDR